MRRGAAGLAWPASFLMLRGAGERSCMSAAGLMVRQAASSSGGGGGGGGAAAAQRGCAPRAPHLTTRLAISRPLLKRTAARRIWAGSSGSGMMERGRERARAGMARVAAKSGMCRSAPTARRGPLMMPNRRKTRVLRVLWSPCWQAPDAFPGSAEHVNPSGQQAGARCRGGRPAGSPLCSRPPPPPLFAAVAADRLQPSARAGHAQPACFKLYSSTTHDALYTTRLGKLGHASLG